MVMAKIHDTWSGSFSGSSISVDTNRIWIDGCFDAMHFGKWIYSLKTHISRSIGSKYPGHARLLLMSRGIGTTVIVEIYSDKEVQAVKGPVVMPLQER